MKLISPLAVCLLLLISMVAFSQPGNKSQVDGYMNEMLSKYKIPGASIAVIKQGKVVKKSNYGISSIEFNLPVTDSTIFALASVTKLFTSTVIMKLSDQGILSIDDPVTKYIDSLPVTWNAIRSGICYHILQASGIISRQKIGLPEPITMISFQCGKSSSSLQTNL